MKRYENPTDSDISFYIGCYQDFEMAEWCIGELRKHYPTSLVFIRCDGDDDSRYIGISRKFNCRLSYGMRLYPTQNGGRIINAMLRDYSCASGSGLPRYLIKIDTDTHIHRRFTSLPDEECLFGSLQSGRNFGQSLQGGCVGFTREAALALWKSNAFMDDKLQDYKATWAKNQTLIDRAEIQGLIGFEWVLAYVLKESGLPYPMVEEPEIRSEWRKYVDNKDLKYAITHPCEQKLDNLRS